MPPSSPRSWVLLVLLVAAGPAAAAEKELDDAQQRALRALFRLNGDILTYYPRDGKLAISVNFAYNLELTDDSLAPLAKLSSLGFLHLGGTSLTDRTLSHLKGLTNLRDLD